MPTNRNLLPGKRKPQKYKEPLIIADMEALKELKELNATLKISLADLSPAFTEAITKIMTGESIVMLPSHKKSDIASFNFEYRHEWLTIIFFGSDASGLTITEDISLLWNDLKAYFTLSGEILGKVDEMEAECEDGDEWEEMMETYDLEKYEIFEDWFTGCWQKARQASGSKLPTYLSMAELDSGFELMTWESAEINKSQPGRRYYNV